MSRRDRVQHDGYGGWFFAWRQPKGVRGGERVNSTVLFSAHAAICDVDTAANRQLYAVR